jgi:hypothetical protein
MSVVSQKEFEHIDAIPLHANRITALEGKVSGLQTLVEELRAEIQRINNEAATLRRTLNANGVNPYYSPPIYPPHIGPSPVASTATGEDSVRGGGSK